MRPAGAVEVQVPGVLRATTGGLRVVQTHPGSLRLVLDELAEQHPELVAMVRRDGDLSPYVNVYLNGKDVRSLGGLEAAVQAGDELMLLVAIVGG